MDKVFSIQLKRIIVGQLGAQITGADKKVVGAIESIDLVVKGQVVVAGKSYSVDFKINV